MKKSRLTPAAVAYLQNDMAAHEWDAETGEWIELNSAWQPLTGPRIPGGLYGAVDGMRILVFTPLDPAYGIRPQALDSIKAAIRTYDGPADWLISNGDNPCAEPYENIAYQHNKARQAMLGGGYDALLSIEADMIVPPDVIDRLMEAAADVAYGLYVWRHDRHLLSAYPVLKPFEGHSLSEWPSWARRVWGQIIDVEGIGMGCTLIRRPVLEALAFRLYDGRRDWLTDEYGPEMEALGIDPHRPRPSLYADDWLFAVEAQRAGFSQRAHLGVICGHVRNDGILWPDPQADGLYRKEPIDAG